MNKPLPPKELAYTDLAGVISVNLPANSSFNTMAAEIAGYNPDRFVAVALRFFLEEVPVVTIYARDKERVSQNGDKIPVHKYKVELSLEELLLNFSAMNFTLTDGSVDIEKMEVINK